MNGVHHAVANVVIEDHLTGVVQRTADGGQLNEDIGTVTALLHHSLDLVQVTDGPGQTVDDGLLILVNVTVGMGEALLVHQLVVVMMVMMIVVMVMMTMMVVVMFVHWGISFLFFAIIAGFKPVRNHTPGIFSKILRIPLIRSVS